MSLIELKELRYLTNVYSLGRALGIKKERKRNTKTQTQIETDRRLRGRMTVVTTL